MQWLHPLDFNKQAVPQAGTAVLDSKLAMLLLQSLTLFKADSPLAPFPDLKSGAADRVSVARKEGVREVSFSIAYPSAHGNQGYLLEITAGKRAVAMLSSDHFYALDSGRYLCVPLGVCEDFTVYLRLDTHEKKCVSGTFLVAGWDRDESQLIGLKLQAAIAHSTLICSIMVNSFT